MTSRCVDEEVLLCLIDGELTENEAERLRQHIGDCRVCAARVDSLESTLRELRAPLLDVDPEAATENFMQRISTGAADAESGQRQRRSGGLRVLVAAMAAVLAMSALIVGRKVLRAPLGASETFRARGAPLGASMKQGIGVSVFRSGSDEALTEETRVGPDDAYLIWYRNLLREPAYLLAFAVDAKGTVHFICPMYLDAKSNPPAVQLPSSTTDLVNPLAIAFEGPAPGPMRFVAILTSSPLHVLDVDGLSGDQLSTAALQARWQDAEVRELVTVHVGSSR